MVSRCQKRQLLNEGIEVEKTIENIRKTADVKIILINDASDDGYDYDSVAECCGCYYIKHAEPKGVAASRDEGVSLCDTKYFLLLDAHMEFYKDRWDSAVVSALREPGKHCLFADEVFVGIPRKRIERQSRNLWRLPVG